MYLSGVAEVLLNILVFGDNLTDAIEAARIYNPLVPDITEYDSKLYMYNYFGLFEVGAEKQKQLNHGRVTSFDCSGSGETAMIINEGILLKDKEKAIFLNGEYNIFKVPLETNSQIYFVDRDLFVIRDSEVIIIKDYNINLFSNFPGIGIKNINSSAVASPLGLDGIVISDVEPLNISFEAFDILNQHVKFIQYKVSDKWVRHRINEPIKMDISDRDNFVLEARALDVFGNPSSKSVKLDIMVKKSFFSARMMLLMFVLIFVGGYFLIQKLVKLNKMSPFAEAQKRREEVDFIKMTLQQLKSPIHGIIGIADSLVNGQVKTGGLSHHQRASIENIIKNSWNAFGVIDQIIDFSSLDEADLRLHWKTFPVQKIINSILFMSEKLIGNDKYKVISEIGDNIKPLKADPERFQQLIYNILGICTNLCESGEIAISAEQFNSQKLNVMISCHTQSYNKDLLALFRKVIGKKLKSYNIENEKEKVYLLRMDTCRKIAYAMNGNLSIEYFQGNGFVFVIQLPCASDSEPLSELSSSGLLTEGNAMSHISFQAAKADFNSQHLRPNHQPQFEPSVHKKDRSVQVLLIEPDDSTSQIIKNYLSHSGYSVMSISTGKEAREILETGMVPDVVLLSLMLPDMSGLDCCRYIRKVYPLERLP